MHPASPVHARTRETAQDVVLPKRTPGHTDKTCRLWQEPQCPHLGFDLDERPAGLDLISLIQQLQQLGQAGPKAVHRAIGDVMRQPGVRRRLPPHGTRHLVQQEWIKGRGPGGARRRSESPRHPRPCFPIRTASCRPPLRTVAMGSTLFSASMAASSSAISATPRSASAKGLRLLTSSDATVPPLHCVRGREGAEGDPPAALHTSRHCQVAGHWPMNWCPSWSMQAPGIPAHAQFQRQAVALAHVHLVHEMQVVLSAAHDADQRAPQHGTTALRHPCRSGTKPGRG